jgi:hypothetical protein
MDTGIVRAFSVLNAWDLSYVLKMHSVLLNATSRAKPFAPFEENETSTKERTWKREEIVVIFV